MAGKEKTPYENSKEKYNELFPDDKTKAVAFDKMAEIYYMCNFGSTGKADVDLLMFSEYIERILEESDEDISQYSDYTLSKYLGITQSRIRSLKEKKQLKYPHPGYDWRESFKNVAKNVRYENGKVIFVIPDKNLFIEISNAIEENGGYIEMQLNPKLMQIPIEYFLDFLIVLDGGGEKERDQCKKKLHEQFLSQKQTEGEIEEETFFETFKGHPAEQIIEMIADVSSWNFSSVTKAVVESVKSVIERKGKKGKVCI